jgi:IclR family transcriptional regulator, KDG regulon repressor
MRNQTAPEIKSLARGVDVLALFAAAGRELSFTEVAAAMDMSKATAHRFLASLTELGLLRRTSSGQATFALGFRLVELGAAAVSHVDLRIELRPFLVVLTERTWETSNLAVLIDGSAVVVDQIESPDDFRMFARVGRSVPAATSSLGKVLFAYADETTQAAALEGELPLRTRHSIGSTADLAEEFETVRRRGYALDREENRIGVVCIGAPVYDLSGRAAAAFSISGPSVRLGGGRLEEAIAAVVGTARDASAALGYQPDSTPEVERG